MIPVAQLARESPEHTHTDNKYSSNALWAKWNVWHLTFRFLKCIVGPGYGGFVQLWMITCMICRGRCSIHFWNGSQSQYPIFFVLCMWIFPFCQSLVFSISHVLLFSGWTTSIIFHHSFLQLPLLPFPFFPPLCSSLLILLCFLGLSINQQFESNYMTYWLIKLSICNLNILYL